MTQDNFDRALQNFVDYCQMLVDEANAKMSTGSYQHRATISTEPGRRYVRLVRTNESGGRSVHCFVDKTNGNVLKAAGWKAPAKHARGNIFGKFEGSMSEYGAVYLR